MPVATSRSAYDASWGSASRPAAFTFPCGQTILLADCTSQVPEKSKPPLPRVAGLGRFQQYCFFVLPMARYGCSPNCRGISSPTWALDGHTRLRQCRCSGVHRQQHLVSQGACGSSATLEYIVQNTPSLVRGGCTRGEPGNLVRAVLTH